MNRDGRPWLGLNLSAVAPHLLREAAVMAEDLGYESVWLGEHIVSPTEWNDEYDSEGTLDGPSPFVEPLLALGHVAAATESIRLGTGVIIGPLRDPFLTARACATLDLLSQGRLELGVGVGWLKAEFEIMGKEFSSRGRRADEFLTVLDTLLTQEQPSFVGRFHDFPPVDFAPKACQSPRPRFHVAGHSEAALRRVARLGDGWIGDAMTPLEALPDVVQALKRVLADEGRDRDSMQLTLMRLRGLTRDELRMVGRLGFDRVVVAPWGTHDRPAKIGVAVDLEPVRSFAALAAAW